MDFSSRQIRFIDACFQFLYSPIALAGVNSKQKTKLRLICMFSILIIQVEIIALVVVVALALDH